MSEDRGFRGLDLLDQVIKQIETEPETWRQYDWAVRSVCNTAQCVAGHAVVLCGAELLYEGGGSVQYANEALFDGVVAQIPALAQELLGLTSEERHILFAGANTLKFIKEYRDEIAERMELESNDYGTE